MGKVAEGHLSHSINEFQQKSKPTEDGENGRKVQWLSMVWDKIPIIWDIIDLSNYSLDWHADLARFDHHENSNVGDTKN